VEPVILRKLERNVPDLAEQNALLVCHLDLHADELEEFDFPREITLEPEEPEGRHEDMWRHR
jgi:hypothetical protein